MNTDDTDLDEIAKIAKIEKPKDSGDRVIAEIEEAKTPYRG